MKAQRDTTRILLGRGELFVSIGDDQYQPQGQYRSGALELWPDGSWVLTLEEWKP